MITNMKYHQLCSTVLYFLGEIGVTDATLSLRTCSYEPSKLYRNDHTIFVFISQNALCIHSLNFAWVTPYLFWLSTCFLDEIKHELRHNYQFIWVQEGVILLCSNKSMVNQAGLFPIWMQFWKYMNTVYQAGSYLLWASSVYPDQPSSCEQVLNLMNVASMKHKLCTTPVFKSSWEG